MRQRPRWTVPVVVLAVVASLVVLAAQLLVGRDDRPGADPSPGPTSGPTSTPTSTPGASGFVLTQFNVRNRDAAVRAALAERPQLLGLNEAGRLVPTYRSAGVPDGYTLTADASGSRERRQNAVLTAPEVRVVSSRSVQLSSAVPGAAYARDRWALVVELDVPGVGRLVHVQAHLNPGVRRYADDDPRARAYAGSVARLDDLLDDLDGAARLTLAGDLNLAADSTRDFAWAPVLRRHDLEVVAQGLDVVAYRGLSRPVVEVLPRGVSDHPAVSAAFEGAA